MKPFKIQVKSLEDAEEVKFVFDDNPNLRKQSSQDSVGSVCDWQIEQRWHQPCQSQKNRLQQKQRTSAQVRDAQSYSSSSNKSPRFFVEEQKDDNEEANCSSSRLLMKDAHWPQKKFFSNSSVSRGQSSNIQESRSMV